MHQVTDLCGACTQLCQVGTALTPSHALNPTENYEIISSCYLLNVSNREVNWLHWSITHLPLLRNICLNSCQGKTQLCESLKLLLSSPLVSLKITMKKYMFMQSPISSPQARGPFRQLNTRLILLLSSTAQGTGRS